MQQMQIQGTEIQIKEYQGKRVVTLKDIDFFRINVTDTEM